MHSNQHEVVTNEEGRGKLQEGWEGETEMRKRRREEEQ